MLTFQHTETIKLNGEELRVMYMDITIMILHKTCSEVF